MNGTLSLPALSVTKKAPSTNRLTAAPGTITRVSRRRPDLVHDHQAHDHHHQVGDAERDADAQGGGRREAVVGEDRRRVVDDHLDAGELGERRDAAPHDQRRADPGLAQAAPASVTALGLLLALLDGDDLPELLGDVVALGADALEHLLGLVLPVLLDQPARALGQSQLQAQHQQGGYGGRTDRDPPVHRLARAHQGRDHDADPDGQLEAEDQATADAGGRHLGDVHRHGLGGAAHGEAQQHPGTGRAAPPWGPASSTGCPRRTPCRSAGWSCAGRSARRGSCTSRAPITAPSRMPAAIACSIPSPVPNSLEICSSAPEMMPVS